MSKRMDDLQHAFSSMHASEMYDQHKREIKANKVIAILSDYLGDLSGKRHLDIGSSTGYMTHLYSKYFGDSTGIDIDTAAVEFANANCGSSKLRFIVGSAMNTELPAKSFDIITCTQIYEHVPDAARLLSEIERLLKDDGVCFFAAGNRFVLMEEHYKLPLLSVVPKGVGHIYVRLAGRGKRYYETHLSLWGLRSLTSKFDIIDYTFRVLEDPVRFHATDMVIPGSFKQRVILLSRPLTYWLVPTYLWLLKPKVKTK
jgi:ubiquinone/menaquinone biosynthesis C-methylase UbiE